MNRTNTVVFFAVLFTVLCFPFKSIQAQQQCQNQAFRTAVFSARQVQNNVRQIKVFSRMACNRAANGNMQAAQRFNQRAMNRIDALNQNAGTLLQASFPLGSTDLVAGASQISGLANALLSVDDPDPTALESSRLVILDQINAVLEGCIRRELQDIGS